MGKNKNKIRILLPLSQLDGFSFSHSLIKKSRYPKAVASEGRSKVEESKRASHTTLFSTVVEIPIMSQLQSVTRY